MIIFLRAILEYFPHGRSESDCERVDCDEEMKVGSWILSPNLPSLYSKNYFQVRFSSTFISFRHLSGTLLRCSLEVLYQSSYSLRGPATIQSFYSFLHDSISSVENISGTNSVKQKTMAVEHDKETFGRSFGLPMMVPIGPIVYE